MPGKGSLQNKGPNLSGDASESVAMGYPYAMKYRLLLHSLSHTTLAVNITGLSVNIAAVVVNGNSLPFIQFMSWEQARQHFMELGAEKEAPDTSQQHLRKTSAAVLTIT
jgi:hypothetical protein